MVSRDSKCYLCILGAVRCVDNPLADLFDLSNASFRHSNLILLLRRRLIFSLARLALLHCKEQQTFQKQQNNMKFLLIATVLSTLMMLCCLAQGK